MTILPPRLEDGNVLSIERCCVCGETGETIYALKFFEVFGMAKEYEQKINICPKCGFIYTSNPFNEDVLANRYKNLSKFEFDGSSKIMEEAPSYKKRCVRQYDFIKRSIGKVKSVFEVGCASGYNLSLYDRDGIDVYGIEPSKNNVASCKNRYGIDLFNGMFYEYKTTVQNSKRYDLVFLSMVLEHIINPHTFIRELSEINSRYMFIEVPTFDYKFCDEPFGMFAEEHVNYFTFENLRELMKTNNYYIVDAAMDFCLDADIPAGFPGISTVWEKKNVKNNYSLTSKTQPVLSSRELLVNYLRKSEENDKKIKSAIDKIDSDTKLAVWGTGHHTSRLLGMTNLKNKNIVKFYDSDIRKDGMEYYGRTITPFNKSDITGGKVETILISTYVAQRAILELIKKDGLEKNCIKLYKIILIRIYF